MQTLPDVMALEMYQNDCSNHSDAFQITFSIVNFTHIEDAVTCVKLTILNVALGKGCNSSLTYVNSSKGCFATLIHALSSVLLGLLPCLSCLYMYGVRLT